MFKNACEKYPDKAGYMYKEGSSFISISFSEVHEKVEQLAGGLAYLGVKKDDKVIILSENRIEWACTDYAALMNGAATVPIYSTLLSPQIKFIINDSDAKIVVVSNLHQFKKIKEIDSEIPKVEKIIVLDPISENHPRMLTYDDLMNAGKKFLEDNKDYLKKSIAKLTRDDLATIIYTSGTTGIPKGVMLTHGNFLSNVEGGLNAIPVSEKDTFLSFLPLSHVFERMVGHYLAFQIGATVAYAESIETVAENLQEVNPTLMTSVPRLFEKIYGKIIDSLEEGSPIKKALFNWAIGVGREAIPYRQKNRALPLLLIFQHAFANALVFSKLKERVGGQIRFFVSGGAPLSKEIGEFFTAAGLLILEGYGLTETSPVISVNRLKKFKFGSVGIPLDNVEVKIADDGEILTKGPHVMKGYYNNEAATKEVIDEEGWFHTGDIGHFDDQGFLVITDRKKNIIVTAGGKNIAPQYIENLLITSRYIEQALVIGDKRKYCSALIVPSMEMLSKFADLKGIVNISPADLLQEFQVNELFSDEIKTVTKELASYETIKKFILVKEPFSIENGQLTPTLKVKRKIVEEQYKDEINSLYAE
jgi:long-chain acyl-CoA synthetase